MDEVKNKKNPCPVYSSITQWFRQLQDYDYKKISLWYETLLKEEIAYIAYLDLNKSLELLNLDR